MEEPCLLILKGKDKDQTKAEIYTCQVGVSGTTSGSNSSLGLFYSVYLGPEIKILEETPYYGRERIFSSFFGTEARLQPFCSSHKA